jgi:predicted metal-dependent phosphoesterase TrpH
LKADFHTHTTSSDGELSPRELIDRAQKLGVNTLAITDHDTTGALKEARAYARQVGLNLIDGIEISCRQGDTGVHLLGYGPRVLEEEILDYAQSFREKKLGRVQRILAKLCALGLPLTLEDLDVHDMENVGRPHVARAMEDKGYVQSMKEAFDKYLSESQKAYVPREEANVEEAIRLLNGMGVVSVIAHPGEIRLEKEEQLACFKHWQSLGLCGIECYHPAHSDEEAQFYANYARQNGLLVLGGSDFHEKKPDGKRHGELGDQCARWTNCREDVQKLLDAIG